MIYRRAGVGEGLMGNETEKERRERNRIIVISREFLPAAHFAPHGTWMPPPSMTRQGGGMSLPRKSSGPNPFLRLLGWLFGLILVGLVAMAGLGFYWLHKAKEAGLNPELIRKNRDLAAAEMAVIRSGDVRVLSKNDAAGTMVVRDKRTGKTTSLKFDPVKKSMVAIDEQARPARVTSDTISSSAQLNIPAERAGVDAGSTNIPSWVPVYPGVSPQRTAQNGNDKHAGTYFFLSSDAPEKILSYYSDQLSSAGMKLSTKSGSEGTTVSAVQDDGKRTVVVTASVASVGTHVTVAYEESNASSKTNP
jgi:hypothetical protein